MFASTPTLQVEIPLKLPKITSNKISYYNLTNLKIEMSFCTKKFCKDVKKAFGFYYHVVYSSGLANARKEQPRRLIINCRKKAYNFYTDTVYKKFEEIPLASKGWNHNKSKNDYFVVQPYPELYLEETKTFEELGINPNMIKVLKDEGIQEATAFQSDVIPKFNSGKHLILAAETGCGKTISYLLPIIQSLIRCPTEELNRPKAVILTPNRELVHQIGGVAKKLAESVGLSVEVLVGGHTKRLMYNPTFSKVDILVSTPGVLSKLSTVKIYKLDDVLFTVLDEADTLLDDSFEEKMSVLMSRVYTSQLILVSATRPKRIPDYLHYIQEMLMEIKSPHLHKPLLNIKQKFWRLTKSVRPAKLLEIAKSNKDPMLVFTNINQRCDWVAMFLRENGLTCSNINGDMNYDIRISQWNNFVSGRTKILSATDVGSRGLDTTQVKHVVNYDFPLYAADYIHRIGRVGRLGSPENTKVTNFICGPEEVNLVKKIELAIRTNQEIPDVDGNITKIFQRKILRKTNNVV